MIHPTDAELAAVPVTPAMVAAGLREYALFESCDPGEWVVTAVFRAMHLAKEADPRDAVVAAARAYYLAEQAECKAVMD